MSFNLPTRTEAPMDNPEIILPIQITVTSFTPPVKEKPIIDKIVKMINETLRPSLFIMHPIINIRRGVF